ncbi:MAG: YtxH domain-containing protein [Thermodesulfobacteriota bacterium]|nr:YtxH domain-containing protein [Thermodesulfobacteriota bacterium]
MSRDDSCNAGVAILSFLTGAVVGAGIALLITPKTGEETREILADYGHEFKNKVSDIPDHIRDRTHDATDRGHEMIGRGQDLIHRGTEMVGQGKEYLEEKKQTLNAAIDAGRQAMKDEKERLESKTALEEEEQV